MVAYADLVLPDTTYLERHDAISLLDRPISDADAAIDAIRRPVVTPDRDVRPFQDVLLDLGARLGLPGMTREDGAPRWPGGFPQYIAEHERAPGVGLLAGFRGADGDAVGVGAPHPEQLQRYAAQDCVFRSEVPPEGRYCPMANRDSRRGPQRLGFVGDDRGQTLALYCEPLQRFRNAARGHGAQQPPDRHRARIERWFDPLPFWAEPFEGSRVAAAEFPLAAVTQRPMFMYHAWGSQNRWLRQIATSNVLCVHPETALRLGIGDGERAELRSHLGRMVVPVRHHRGVEPGTVWTWNAIGKRRGSWALDPDAPEGRRGFLLNHLISDRLPAGGDGDYANADPVTGQAAWFDLRVALRPLPAGQAAAGDTEPQFPVLPRPGSAR
jgi:anaerobic selenocysteine-containing dehydrogenase